MSKQTESPSAGAKPREQRMEALKAAMREAMRAHSRAECREAFEALMAARDDAVQKAVEAEKRDPIRDQVAVLRARRQIDGLPAYREA